jgi:hypothetical protein
VVNVLAGIIGALLGFSGVLLGGWMKSRDEQRRWLRDQKLAGAAELIGAGTNIFELRSGNADWLSSPDLGELRQWQSQLQKGRAVIHLLCTRRTRDDADSFVRSCWRAGESDGEDKAVTALRAFNASLRKEIGSE